MIGQTAEIAPADKRIYALRDVTATVECIPLIVASILSKKLAEGIDGLVLDVKVGRGAFMKDRGASARALAQALVRVGTRAGKRVVALLTDMEAPLGRADGQRHRDARGARRARAAAGRRTSSSARWRLGAEMLVLGGKAKDAAEGRARLAQAIAKGEGARVMERMIVAQGGDPRVVEQPECLAVSKSQRLITASRAGYVAGIDALEVGLAAVSLGAGRKRADEAVDPSVGIELLQTLGDRVDAGAPLARVFVRESMSEATVLELTDRIHGAFQLGDAPPPPRPLVIDCVG